MNRNYHVYLPPSGFAGDRLDDWLAVGEADDQPALHSFA
jgi:hypothetical protein